MLLYSVLGGIFLAIVPVRIVRFEFVTVASDQWLAFRQPRKGIPLTALDRGPLSYVHFCGEIRVAWDCSIIVDGFIGLKS